MSKNINQALDSLVRIGADGHLCRLKRGLEKESLRVDVSGVLAQTPHPAALGSALTNPMITTDYSESLLEFVTPIHNSIDGLLKNLFDIHHFTYQHIGDEKLWVNSMPCIVESEEKIPIARYGSSNVAKMKEAYRRGLSHRYGPLMQTIAGIHFNFSLPEEFWELFCECDTEQEQQDSRSSSYFSLIRNFHRHSWINCYLFGASPAVCRSFLRGREHFLQDFETHSFYAPNATSLRLSGLGYSNDAQSVVEISYNGVDEFVRSLRLAIQTPHADYERFGVKVDGVYQQLNTNLLQIENEFYSSIRPKRVAASGESPSRALSERGVEYVEVRSIDLNPFVPVGIDDHCIRYLDTFLLYCMLTESGNLSFEEFQVTRENQQKMVMNGRDPDETVTAGGATVSARGEMSRFIEGLRPVAELMDQICGDGRYGESLDLQNEKISDSGLTPSAMILDHMLSEDLSFYEFSMQMSERSETLFKQATLEPATIAHFEELARESLENQRAIEESDTLSFDDFLADYFRRQNA